MMNDRRAIGYVVEIDGPSLLVNLLEESRGHVAGHRDGLSTVEQPGDLIGVEGGADIIVVRIQSVAYAEPKEVHNAGKLTSKSNATEPLRQLKGRVIGYLARSERKLKFFAQDWRLPVLGSSAFPLSDEEAMATIGGRGSPEGQLPLGSDSRNPSLDARVNVNDLLGRHLAVLGATGQGKTHFVAAVLQQLVRASSHPRIIVFDVNGEYFPAFAPWGDRVKRTVLGSPPASDMTTDVQKLRVPYYALGRHGLARLLLPSERTQMPALRFAVEHLKYITADAFGARACGQPINTLFDDCRTDDAQAAFTQLEMIRKKSAPEATVWPHMRGLSALAAESYSLKMGSGRPSVPQRDAFSFGHIHSLINRMRSLIDDAQFTEVVDVSGGNGVGTPLSMEKESASLVENVFGPAAHDPNGWMIHILDLSRLTQDLMPFVLGSLLELYAAELFRRGPGRTHPTMLVLEEAHHYLRQLPGDADIGQHSLAYERLAKEGRKFGLSLMISTQRPSEVSSTVLAQCGTWAVFRLSNDSDQKAVGSAAEAAGVNVTRQLSGLGRGEAIIFGAALPVPTRISVIRPNPEPDSKDPPFEAAWGYRDRQL